MAYSNINSLVKDPSVYKCRINRQIVDAFRVFDADERGSTEIKNLGTIVRAVGRVPRKAELKNFIKQVRDPDDVEFAKLEAVLPALRDILLKDIWKPVSKDVLLQAFEFFDQKKSGSLDPEYMRKLLTEHGDAFDDSEVERFLEFAVDPESKKVDYRSICEEMVEALTKEKDALEDEDDA